MGQAAQKVEHIVWIVAQVIFYGVLAIIVLIMIMAMIDDAMRHGGGGAMPDSDMISRVASETAAQTVRAMQGAGSVGTTWPANAALAATIAVATGLGGIRRA